MFSRRQLLGAGAAGAALVSSKTWAQTSNMGLPEAASMEGAATQTPTRPSTGPDYNPVVTLNGWTLPFRMNNGVKEFHLIAEPVEREMAEGMTAYLWGYNGQSPARPSRLWRATGCASSSPTSCQSTPRSIGTA